MYTVSPISCTISCSSLYESTVVANDYTCLDARWPSGLEHWTGDPPGLNPTAATSLRNFGNSVYPALPVYFGGVTKAVGPFYLVSMLGEVKDPTSLHWKCVTCRRLHHSLRRQL